MNEKIEFAARLKAAMIDAGYEPRPIVLETQFNSRHWGRSITFQTASSWLRGRSIPEQDKLQVLAEWLAVEPQVLRYGEQGARAVREKRLLWSSGMALEDRELVEALLILPVPQKRVVREIVLALAAQVKRPQV